MPGDSVVGMVVADPAATLLTVCANGYGKRTPLGPNLPEDESPGPEPIATFDDVSQAEQLDDQQSEPAPQLAEADSEQELELAEDEESPSSQRCYRTQRRGGKGLRDIQTIPRNGPVIGICCVHQGDELLMITARGKIQRMAADDIRVIGRNTKGVKIMTLDEGDTLVAVKRLPKEENGRPAEK